MTVLTLQPDDSVGIDTVLRAFSPTLNFGTGTTLSAGFDTGSSSNRRALIKFDLSSIPANAIISSAILTLNCSSELAATDTNFSLNQSLVQWYEGTHNGSAPGAGEDGSTWNLRNANGSVAWGAAGGLAGTDYASSPSATTLVTGTGFFSWNLTSDVQKFFNGTLANNGWWILSAIESVSMGQKQFDSSGNATPANRPKLVITYQIIQATAAGTSTAAATLKAKGNLVGSANGIAVASATPKSNQNIKAIVAGTSVATAFLGAEVFIRGNSFGDSTAVAHIIASYPSFGVAAGTSTAIGRIVGRFNLQGLASGVGSPVGRLSSKGHIFGAAFGTSTAIAIGYARALNVANIIGCNPVPLLHITDGSVRPNGQLNLLNFLSERAGYLLSDWKPQVSQYKDGGSWSSSPQSQGRRLVAKVFENVIDVFEVAATASDQDSLIEFQRDLIDFQEAASDYWASDSAFVPYYLVARAARETKTRYAIIHMISCPQLENPYTQPFFDNNGAVFTALTIRIEHGLWASTPPGKFDCVEVSGQREWTVSGWQVGS